MFYFVANHMLDKRLLNMSSSENKDFIIIIVIIIIIAMPQYPCVLF